MATCWISSLRNRLCYTFLQVGLALTLLALLAQPAAAHLEGEATVLPPQLVKDIAPGQADSMFHSAPLGYAGGLVYFAAEGDFSQEVELWCSDGTEAGTRLVKDIRPGGEASDPWNLV